MVFLLQYSDIVLTVFRWYFNGILIKDGQLFKVLN